MPSLSAKAKVSASVTVTVRDPGRLWTLQDLRTASSYKISLDPGGKLLGVASLVATAPLHDYLPKAGATYLSMAAEPKGHMYILSYTGDGSSPEDYQLDIYQPNGPWLTRTTGLNAAKIVVDMWRNLYTLNYEALEAPVPAPSRPSAHGYRPASSQREGWVEYGSTRGEWTLTYLGFLAASSGPSTRFQRRSGKPARSTPVRATGSPTRCQVCPVPVTHLRVGLMGRWDEVFP